MSKVRRCDFCRKDFGDGENVHKIVIQCYVEDSEIPKESNPDMVDKDACENCAVLFIYSWDNYDNIKAMFASVKSRKVYQEQKNGTI